MSGAWDAHYARLDHRFPYGDTSTYHRAADFVRGRGRIEDWGCGGGWLATLLDGSDYHGVDGSCTPFAELVTDLTTYRTAADCIVLRHVLEHSYEWAAILDNAVASFLDRLCLVLFTPLVSATTVILTEPDYHSVPVIAFYIGDILDRLPRDTTVTVDTFPTSSFYGVETVVEVER